MTEKLAYSVAEFAQATGVAKGTVYARIKKHEIEAIEFGRRKLIPISVVKKFTKDDN